MQVETTRLRLRELTQDDAGFIHQLLNDPDWLRHIGDRGVRTLDDARRYLVEGPQRAYAEYGFGLWAVTTRDADAPIGLCGLLKRDVLDDLDIGYALLPSGRGLGYAGEAAQAVIDYARIDLEVDRVLAVTDPGNTTSIQLLESLGFAHARDIALHEGRAPSRLYSLSTARP